MHRAEASPSPRPYKCRAGGVQVSRRAAVAARGRSLAGAGNEGNASRFSAFPEPLPPHPVTPAPRSPGFRAAPTKILCLQRLVAAPRAPLVPGAL